MINLVTHIQNLAAAIRDKLNLMNATLKPAGLGAVFSGGGFVIVSGELLSFEVPFDCLIKSWTLLADQAGHAELDIWVTDFNNAPPSSSNTIVGSNAPKLVSALKAHSNDLSGWMTPLDKGDIIVFSVTSASIVTQLTLTLQVDKT